MRAGCLRTARGMRALQLEPALIGRWPIDRWHGNVEKTQINTELRAMMNHVAHHEAAQHGRPWQRKDILTTHQQRPFALPLFVSCSFERGPRRGYVLVKRLYKLGARLLFFRTRWRLSRRRHIKFSSRKSLFRPTWNLREMRCESAERHRLLMRLPTELVVGNSFERLARVRHFVFELGKNHLTDRHSDLRLIDCANCKRT